MEEFDGRRGTVQLSQQRVAPCVKWVEYGLGTRGLRIVAEFWTSILVSSALTVGRSYTGG